MEQLVSPLAIRSTAEQGYDLSHGFLPTADPIRQLPAAFAAWEQLANELPKLLMGQYTRKYIEALPDFPLNDLTTGEQLERAMMILSYIGHGYVWDGHFTPPTHIPANLALPWFKISQQLGRPPILSYASYALYNWRRLDVNKPIELGNIALLQNFLSGMDEEWFVLVHIDIEQKAIPAIAAILQTQQELSKTNPAGLIQQLTIIHDSLQAMITVLERMPECCDPYIYYNRVRPYIHGWKDNPATPEGLIYSGVEHYQGKPIKFKGETGAQSGIIPVLDALLGVSHAESPLLAHLKEMRSYMPASHREFLETLEKGPSLREYIISTTEKSSALRDCYNDCLRLVHKFRLIHLQYAAQYVHKQQQTSLSNPTAVGTGGTPFMAYLLKHATDTEKDLL